jgi:hypothetical protein
MVWGGLLLAAVNLVALYLTSGSGTAADPGAGPVGSTALIWFGLIAAAAGIVFDRWTRER